MKFSFNDERLATFHYFRIWQKGSHRSCWQVGYGKSNALLH